MICRLRTGVGTERSQDCSQLQLTLHQLHQIFWKLPGVIVPLIVEALDAALKNMAWSAQWHVAIAEEPHAQMHVHLFLKNKKATLMKISCKTWISSPIETTIIHLYSYIIFALLLMLPETYSACNQTFLWAAVQIQSKILAYDQARSIVMISVCVIFGTRVTNFELFQKKM